MDYETHYDAAPYEYKKFHHNHGKNIIFSEDNTVAYRTRSFDGAEIYSHNPLGPGELFLVEIEKTERGWSGHMRIGLTRRDPNVELDKTDYSNLQTDWIVAITKAQINAAKNQVAKDFEHLSLEDCEPDQLNGTKRLSYDKCNIRTCRGVIPRYCLKSNTARRGELYPSDVGSRIGVMYIPTSESKAHMHIIINGEDTGPLATDIPYRDAPLYVTIVLYGTTKKIRIIQSSYVPSLQAVCREMILQRVPDRRMVNLLPLPRLLKNFLLYDV